MIRFISDPKTPKASEQLGDSSRFLKAVLSREDLGFLQLPKRDALWTSSVLRAKQIESCDVLAIIGIGGSSLGAKALLSACAPEALGSKIVFFENVDPVSFENLWNHRIQGRKVHWCVVSKSGTTLETLSIFECVLQRLENQKAFDSKNFTVITEPKSNPLRDWARGHNISCLEIPLDVGGRFSVLSPVGLFPAAFAGLDLAEIREGATWAIKSEKLIEDLLRQVLFSWKSEQWISVFWSYADGLKEFGFWLQQLWAESLGKKLARDGSAAARVSTPLSLVGSVDQHSILQMIYEGARDKSVLFVTVRDFDQSKDVILKSRVYPKLPINGLGLGQILSVQAKATHDSLSELGLPCSRLELDNLGPANLGAYFMVMELLVASLGEALNIDAFNQPGVERGKEITRSILSKRVESSD